MTAETLTEIPAPERHPARRRGVVVAVIVVFLALVAAAAAWPVRAAVARNAIDVRTDARPWVCSSGSVVTRELDDSVGGQPEYASLAVIAKNLHCQLRIIIDNPGSQAVTVNELTLPLMGPANALKIEATQLDGDFSTVLPTGGKNDVDARFAIPGGLTIDPGTSQLVLMTVVYAPKTGGCTMSAGSAELDSQTTLQTTALDLPGSVTAQHSPYGFTTPPGTCA